MFDVRTQRIILGALTLVMAGVALWLNVFDKAAGESYAAVAAGSVHMTAVLAILWIALPEARQGAGMWLFAVAAIIAVTILIGRGKVGLKVIVPAIAILGALAFLRRFTAALRANGVSAKSAPALDSTCSATAGADYI
ncbi:MAG: hypothetical protein QM775_17495 [Pirellulales bacterium]